MAMVTINKDTLVSIADAIRSRNKETDKYFLKDMPQAVRDIYNNPKNTYMGSNSDMIVIGECTPGPYQNTKLTTIGEYAFASNPNVTKVNIPNATTIGERAFNASALTEVDEFDLMSARDIGKYAFYSCDNLKTVYLPSAVTLDNFAFWYCDNLEAIYLPMVQNINYESGYSSYGAFYGCSNLKHIYVGANSIDEIKCRGRAMTIRDLGAPSDVQIHYGYVG